MDSNGTSIYEEKEAGSASLQTATERIGTRASLCGFILYAVFAPHSIAGAEIGLALVALGWLARSLATKRTGLRRTPQDLPIALFLAWTLFSSILSAEPGISLAKFQSVCVLFLFYLTQAAMERRWALPLVALMILSGVAGVLWSVVDIARGRGVRIEEMAEDSPFRLTPVQAGDAVWRIGQRRVSSIEEIDEAIRRAPPGARLSVSFITQGEHSEWPAIIITDEARARPSPSGLKGTSPTHRFRASGWTRHYETFSETLQILAQLALGLGLARLRRRKMRGWRVWAWLTASVVLALGIMLTAMRTVLVAFAIGASLLAWRAVRKGERLLIYAAILVMLVAGALAVGRTRVSGALSFQDASTHLRLQVAGIALKRLAIHPFFGHGMDAVKKHWTEWGFPGTDVIHTHSTPLQLAFERGLPALLFWLWIIASFWMSTTRAERLARDSADANRHGLLLGATGALAGLLASSLVNYNFGDGEVALVFWWLMGIVTRCGTQNTELRTQNERQ
ncbi:MAG TPA: O-antigen ligase family protein [Pyrinomonadaceae bacterium]